MACINVLNTEHTAAAAAAAAAAAGVAPMSPRISFSNDFAVNDPPPPRPNLPAVDPTFEFSVGSRPMMAADELFFKGRMLPLRGEPARLTTLRDELRSDGPRPPKAGPTSFFKLIGLKKPNCSNIVKKNEPTS